MIWMLSVYSVKIVLKRFMIYEFGKNAKQVAKTEFGRDDRKPQNKQDGSFVAHIVLISSQEARHHSSSLPLILPQPKQGHQHRHMLKNHLFSYLVLTILEKSLKNF